MSIEYRKQRVPFNKPIFDGLPLDATVELECIPFATDNCPHSFLFEYTTSTSLAIQIEVSLEGNGVYLRSSLDGKIKEEWIPRSISLDKKIQLSIVARKSYFEIALNDQHVRDFNYQLPLQEIKKLSIRGDIGILSVRFIDFGSNLEPPRPGCENFYRFSNRGLPLLSPTPFIDPTFNRAVVNRSNNDICVEHL